MGLPLGWLADHIGPRRLIVDGGALLGAALLVDGEVSRPWHLYAAFGVLTSLGVGLAGWVPAVILVQRWFPSRVSTALGIGSAGIGYSIPAAIMPALTADTFRSPHFGAIFGGLHLSNAVGGSLGPWVAGRVFDRTGSYWPAFATAMAGVGLAVAAVGALRPSARTEVAAAAPSPATATATRSRPSRFAR